MNGVSWNTNFDWLFICRPDDTVTIFEEVSSNAEKEKVTKKRARKATKGGDEPPAKRKSKKQYNGAVVE